MYHWRCCWKIALGSFRHCSVNSTNMKIGVLSSGIGMELHERFAGKGLR